MNLHAIKYHNFIYFRNTNAPDAEKSDYSERSLNIAAVYGACNANWQELERRPTSAELVRVDENPGKYFICLICGMCYKTIFKIAGGAICRCCNINHPDAAIKIMLSRNQSDLFVQHTKIKVEAGVKFRIIE